MVNLFRITAFLEGVSLLLLLFIAMPLKYIWDSPYMVQKVGMAHGILFIAYIVFAFLIKNELKWSNKTLFFVCFASVIPFGTFIIEKKIKREFNQ
ncbi:MULTISPECIES: DUF3817 domain-containing protein [unclassified Myroides]|uniref:DUF3817 domain-containing protein n=1 Tax=unclassified Myroides TaxID=2642485 RepID=UPI0015F848C1|nr:MULTISPECIES: DUF3817 domain-containing protein [unclassified Myroides]MBB1149648.1 DUF3817 domain-containing protein [Myroides sp. NP-2]MDM1407120.1 DUF3817 domain-containing protein [Myroides sp. DF42-4-2]